MKIESLRAKPFALPLAEGRESRSAAYAATARSITAVLIEVVADTGEIGIAEAPIRSHVYGDSAVGVVAAVEQFFGPALQGADPFDTEALAARLRPPYGPAGNIVARAAIDIAVHDLASRSTGLSAAALLGGRTREVMLLTWILALNGQVALIDEAQERAATGYRSFKVKVGEDPRRDIALVTELRRQLGDNVLIYVDANEGYELDEVLKVSAAFADADVWAIEDPCRVAIPADIRRDLARKIPLPVLGDSCCFTPDAVLRELRSQTLSIVSLKVARSGYRDGIFITRLAQEFGARIVIGTQAETVLGTAAAAQLWAAQPTIFATTELSFYERMTAQIVAGPFGSGDGKLAVPTQPGLGVEVCPVELERYRLPPPA